MSTEITLTCPKCQTRLKAAGDSGSVIRIQCAGCGKSLKVTVPGTSATAVQVPAVAAPIPRQRSAGRASSTPGVIPPNVSFPAVQRPIRNPHPGAGRSQATKKKFLGTVLVFAAVAGLVLLIGVGVWILNSLDLVASNDSVADGVPTALPGGIEEASKVRDEEFANRSVPTKSAPEDVAPGTFETIQALAPREIVDRWFEIRELSEEGQRLIVANPGSSEYESRVERYLLGERQSYELLRTAIASPRGDEALQDEMANRNRKFFDKYQFGLSPQEARDSEARLRKDPRLANRKWKDLLTRYMRSAFFPYSKPTQMKGSREFLEQVRTLEKYAVQLNQYFAMGQPKESQKELVVLCDRMIEHAIEALSIRGPYSVPRDHETAANVFVEFALALMKESGMNSVTPEADALLAETLAFAAAQFDDPVTRRADEMRRIWAEVKNPQLKLDRERAERIASEKKKADDQAARIASLDAHRKASEERSNQRAQDAMEGRSSRMPSGLQDRLGNRGGMRDGTRPRPGIGGPRFGGSGRPSATQSFRDGVMLKIEGDVDTEKLVAALAAKLKTRVYLHNRHRTTSTVLLQWTGTMQEIADQVDFGKVVEVRESSKQLKIQM